VSVTGAPGWERGRGARLGAPLTPPSNLALLGDADLGQRHPGALDLHCFTSPRVVYVAQGEGQRPARESYFNSFQQSSFLYSPAPIFRLQNG
jgi:hypothetical protein